MREGSGQYRCLWRENGIVQSSCSYFAKTEHNHASMYASLVIASIAM